MTVEETARRATLEQCRGRLDRAVAADARSAGARGRRRGPAALRAQLAALPPVPGDILLLVVAAGHTLNEAAAITGCTPERARREVLFAIRALESGPCPQPRPGT